MKQAFGLSVMAVVLVTLMFVGLAAAELQRINWKVTDMVEGTTSTGKPYIRLICDAGTKTFQGHEYRDEVVVMAFGDLADIARNYAIGDDLMAVVSSRDWEGSTYYQIKTFITN